MKSLTFPSALFWSLIWLICIYLVLPTLVVIPVSFNPGELIRFPPDGFSLRWYGEYFRQDEWVGATVNSFVVACLTTLLSLALGVVVCYGLIRGQMPFRNLVVILFLLPLIVPTIVTAVALYRVFAPLNLVGTTAGMVLAHTVLALPFVVINVSAVMQRMDWSTEQAARSLGASPLKAFFLITLPMLRPGIAAGAFFAFITSFDEVVVSRYISGTILPTLPVKMWAGLRFELNPIIASVSTMLVLLTLVVLCLMLFRRKDA